MKKIFNTCCSLVLMAFFLVSCSQNKPAPLNEVDLLINNEDQLTQVIIYDVFTPPVASRIYVYSSLASYEAIRFAKEGTSSIAEKLNGFGKMPLPEKGKNYNFSLAATKAFFKVTRNVKVFSIDSLTKYEQSVYNNYKANLDDATYKNSIAFGDTVAAVILARAKTDGYAISRGKQKYLGSSEPGKWRPTPPDYLDGVEWCWNTMKPMVLDSASQFMPNRPPKYDTKPGTSFYSMMKEVYDINKNLTDEQKLIAKYWDDNPFVIEHAGHMVYGNKKITPGGHWIGITAQVVKQANADAVKSAQSFALTAVALYDGFISCWDEKYRSSYVRPVNVINELLDKNWAPLLQTPPFPEYTSGHSTITASAATVLTKLYGENFAFEDSSDYKYIGLKRKFSSFQAAASEASISRVYGGIHYTLSVNVGNEQGKKVGALVVKKLLE
jgi:PAP2 superfamily